MADRNFNQGHQSNQEWDNEQNRSRQDNDWSSQQQGNTGYGNQQYRGSQQGQRDVGYSGDSAHGMGAGNQGHTGRVNYLPDNDDNRQQYGNMQRGSQGYRNEGQGHYGQAGHQQNQGEWNQGSSYGNQHRQQGQQGGSWSSDQGWQNQGQQQSNYGQQHHDYGNRGFGSGYGNSGGSYGNMSNNQNRGDWNRNRFGSDDRYDSRRNDNNENWWDRTKDKVSDWFDGDDDDKRRNMNRNYSGSHRGKGPSDYRRSQDRIREDICDRLTDDDRVDASNIRVQFDEENTVILSGTVSSREEKRRAEDLVESISGVRNVENRLRVGAGTGSERHLASHDYTGTTDRTGGIGTESGTTNEIIRNVQEDKKAGQNKDWKDE